MQLVKDGMIESAKIKQGLFKTNENNEAINSLCSESKISNQLLREVLAENKEERKQNKAVQSALLTFLERLNKKEEKE